MKQPCFLFFLKSKLENKPNISTVIKKIYLSLKTNPNNNYIIYTKRTRSKVRLDAKYCPLF